MCEIDASAHIPPFASTTTHFSPTPRGTPGPKKLRGKISISRLAAAKAMLARSPRSSRSSASSFARATSHRFERDDALAIVRRDLCTGESPRILQYAGQGPLRAWLTVAATRALLKLKRAQRHDGGDDALLAERASGDDPELQYLKAKYREDFREAVADAITRLPAKSALVLKQSVVDGLSIDALASLHGTHRATCARWIAQAREELLTLVRTRFGERARVQGAELESVLRLLESNFDVSVRRHLVRVAP